MATKLRKPKGGNAPSRVATALDLQDFNEAELKRGYKEHEFQCGKCSGTGRYWGPGGVCFGCNGHGRVLGRLYTPERRQELDEAREKRIERKKEQKKERAQAEKMHSLRTYPEAHKVSARIMDDVHGIGLDSSVEIWGGFIVDVATKGEKYGFTEAQARTLVKAYEKQVEIKEKRQKEKEELRAAPQGRQTVKGEVLHVSQRETQYGITWKMVVLDDLKYKVWSTVPKDIRTSVPAPLDDNLKGRRVTFDATIEPSREDPTFSFASRPSKGRVLDE